jgi:hypothetical protein
LTHPTERDVAKLAEAAIGVLEPADEEGADLQSLPPAVIREQIAAAAQSLGVTPEDAAQLAAAAARDDLAPGVAQAVVAELQRDDALAEEIADAYARRQDLMAVDPLTISAAALLLLVLRIRRVRISKKGGVDVTLDPLKADVVKAVLGFVGGPR